MQIKRRERWQLAWLCAAILLTACCFRTAAVWGREDKPAPFFEALEYTQPSEQPFVPDAALVQVEDRAGVAYDLDALLSAPVELALSDEPVILIVHTHATEAYVQTENYRSSDPEENMVHIGNIIAQRLNANGICTLHDTRLHDASGYDAAYERTEAAIGEFLEQYPSIRMVIDVHRDAIQAQDGTQLPRTTVLHGQEMAQLLLVMGTDTPELPHPNWEENLSFAVKLQAYIAKAAPDLMRPLMLRSARYNEHMTPYSFLLEVGTAGNTQEQARRAAEYFAEQLSSLLKAVQ